MLDTIFLLHHSHTDLGYTHDPPIVWRLHARFLDAALDACETDADNNEPHAMRWTIECLAPLLYWLQRAPSRQIERFLVLEKAGRIEVAGLWGNMTPLLSPAEALAMLQPLKTLRRDYGLDIRYAMNCDVNGHPWWLPDMLIEAGLDGLTMAINEHAGGAPPRPRLFKWEGPGGHLLPVYNGWHYHMGNWLGFDGPNPAVAWLDRLTPKLAAVDYTLPFLMVQITHPFGDNGSVYRNLPQLVAAWNAASPGPVLRLATPRMLWAALQPCLDDVPTYRGDWTDYWNFGALSCAREVRVARHSRAQLLTADLLQGLLGSVDADSVAPDREEAWRDLLLWNEHTFGADVSVSRPDSDDAAAQWHHKGSYAWKARSLSLMLQRDALGQLVRGVMRPADAAVLAFNPLPWDRLPDSPVPQAVLKPMGSGEDGAASRHWQDRERGAGALPPAISIPGCGYAVVRTAQIVKIPMETSQDGTWETDDYRFEFDLVQGGLSAWSGKADGRSWIRAPFGRVISERPADRRSMYQGVYGIDGGRGFKPGWRADRQASTLVQHVRTDWQVRQTWRLEALQSTIEWSLTLLPGKRIELTYKLMLDADTEALALYIEMPFLFTHPWLRYDIGGHAVEPEKDQIPGCCRDYFTAHQWVAMGDQQGGHVVVACPDAPMFMAGDFNFAADQKVFKLAEPRLLSWLTNNYWDTNFRASQPGPVVARYVLQTGGPQFDAAEAHRVGMEAAFPIVYQSTFEPCDTPRLPSSGQLLRLPTPPVFLMRAVPTADTSVVLYFFNTSADEVTSRIDSACLTIQAAVLCDLFGSPQQALSLHQKGVELTLGAHQTIAVSLLLDVDQLHVKDKG